MLADWKGPEVKLPLTISVIAGSLYQAPILTFLIRLCVISHLMLLKEGETFVGGIRIL